MVSVDFDQSSSARINLAAELAARFNSLLIGVAGWPLVKRPREDGRNESVEWVLNELEKLEVKFQNVAGKITDRLEWRSSMSFPREVIAAEARAADLVVIGQSLLPAILATPTIRDQLFSQPAGQFCRTATDRSS